MIELSTIEKQEANLPAPPVLAKKNLHCTTCTIPSNMKESETDENYSGALSPSRGFSIGDVAARGLSSGDVGFGTRRPNPDSSPIIFDRSRPYECQHAPLI